MAADIFCVLAVALVVLFLTSIYRLSTDGGAYSMVRDEARVRLNYLLVIADPNSVMAGCVRVCVCIYTP